MKKYLVIILFLIVNVDATSGSIKQSSVIECNGKYYGSHGSPMHFHEVIKKDDKWISNSLEVEAPSCYKNTPNVKEEVLFNKCVDGDTFRASINGEVITVRLLAIDTPESVHPEKEVELLGKESSEYTCNLLTKAQKIVLEYDKNSDKEDKYGRKLAFVYVDNKMLQKELISIGYAKVAYLYGDYTYTNELKELETTAKNNKLGLWKEEKEIEKETIFDKIFAFISQIIDKIFDFIESVL